MAQNSLSRLLGADLIQASTQYNQDLNLPESAVRILQTLVCDEVTGQMDIATTAALIHQNYSEVLLRTLVQRKRKKANLSSLKDTWEECMKFLEKGSPRQLVQETLAEMGRLNREILQVLVKEMAGTGAHMEALILAAAYFKLPLGDASHVLAFRYDPNLTHTYLSQIAFSDTMVHPALDSKRKNGVFTVEQASQKTLSISFGPRAFSDLTTLEDALRKALAVEVRTLTPPPTTRNLSDAAKDKVLQKTRLRFGNSRAIQFLRGLGDLPSEGPLDGEVIEGIARFQKKKGLSADGDAGPNTLKAMRDELYRIHMFEGWGALLTGYHCLWEEDLGFVAYDVNDKEGDVWVDETIPGFKILRLGKKAFSRSPNELTTELFRGLSPLTKFKGDNFTGPHSAMVDRAFLPLLKRIDEYAGTHGVKIFISGPSAASFRREGTVVSGNIVAPSENSNHKIGHAIDMNLVVAATGLHMNSKALDPSKESQWPREVKGFIQAIRQDKDLRWGGDFRGSPDPVHIDDGLNVFDRSQYEQRYIAVQMAAQYIPAGRGLLEEIVECEN